MLHHLHQLSSALQSFRFPSTTARRPRSLSKFQKYKASESRAVLLFGFVIFKCVLKEKYYDHFVKLVVAIHFAENRALTSTMAEDVKTLLREFLIDYPKLYTTRHNPQVVHSVNHVGQTISDYGPLTSYSTFHFENILGNMLSLSKSVDSMSLLGMIMRTIKSTRREEVEMIGNLNLFRSACFHLHDSTMNTNIKFYMENMISVRGYHASESNLVRPMHPTPAIDRISTIFSNQNLRFFTSCKIGNNRYTTVHYSQSEVADDSAVIFRLGDQLQFGLIKSIFADEDNDILLELWPLSNAKDLTIVTTNKNIRIPSIQEGLLKNNNNFNYVSPGDIIEKCVYCRNKPNKVIFFRYPSLEGGS